ncbi:hypothetical protein AAH991_08925 [Microbispora sp. ZYX-F-249]|uniref:IrrE N-terminal-like domain-containing protein n=1 Tax=Microbispora maris TaxID=3144104 RepID=A0ABV0ALZ5_9ACTN
MPSPELRAALESARIPVPFRLETYLEEVERIRDRRLHTHDLPIEATSVVSGLWIATRKADHIFVAPGAVGVLRINIVLHEVSHMLLNHGKVGDVEEVLSRLMRPAVGAIGAVAARTRYEAREEREAEALATLILMRANEWPSEGDHGLRIIEQTFGYGGRYPV